MSTLDNIASLVTSAVPTISKLIVASKAFKEHRNLVLGTADLTTGSHVTTHIAKTIWVHGQAFTTWSETWKWVYQIHNLETRRACVHNLVTQKIRSLDVMAKSSEEISGMLKKGFVHLGFEKKNSKELRANLDGYIKAVSFAILFVCTKFSLLNLE